MQFFSSYAIDGINQLFTQENFACSGPAPGINKWREVVNDHAGCITLTGLTAPDSFCDALASLFTAYAGDNQQAYRLLFASIHAEYPNLPEEEYKPSWLQDCCAQGRPLTTSMVKIALDNAETSAATRKKITIATTNLMGIKKFCTRWDILTDGSSLRSSQGAKLQQAFATLVNNRFSLANAQDRDSKLRVLKAICREIQHLAGDFPEIAHKLEFLIYQKIQHLLPGFDQKKIQELFKNKEEQGYSTLCFMHNKQVTLETEELSDLYLTYSSEFTFQDLCYLHNNQVELMVKDLIYLYHSGEKLSTEELGRLYVIYSLKLTADELGDMYKNQVTLKIEDLKLVYLAHPSLLRLPDLDRLYQAGTELHPGDLLRLRQESKQMDSDDLKKLDNTGTLIQKNIRRFISNKRHVPEPGGDVAAMKNAAGEVVGYNLKLEGHQFPWVAFPELLDKPGGKGSFKQHTHGNDEIVGLTLFDPLTETLSKELLQVITDNNLNVIVAQRRIDQSRLIARKLGEHTLHYLIFVDKKHAYNYIHFQELASNIDTLHSLGIVHRDIKPENISFVNGKMYLFDNDSMNKVINIKKNTCFGTNAYLNQAFIDMDDSSDRNKKINAYKKDQYNFFMTMMTTCLGEKPFMGRYRPNQIKTFLATLPCDGLAKDNLFDFLNIPSHHSLSAPLSGYLQKPDLPN